jgi:hypothetical protein
VKTQNTELQNETERLQDRLTVTSTNMANLAMELEGLKQKYSALVAAREGSTAASCSSLYSSSPASEQPASETKSSTLDESKENEHTDASARGGGGAGGGAGQLFGASGSGAKGMLHLQQMLDDDRDSASELRAQLQDARELLELDGKDLDEFTSKVVNSRQFRQLRKMLDTKNTQLMDLRKRIVQYEPDNTSVSSIDIRVSAYLLACVWMIESVLLRSALAQRFSVCLFAVSTGAHSLLACCLLVVD